MNDRIYHRLAGVLDTLPNGFPASRTGLEIKLLKLIFTPEEAELFCDLTLTPETAHEIAERTGRPIDQLEEKLISMFNRGEIGAKKHKDVRTFRMLPWVVGIYEMQLERMTPEFAELCEAYNLVLGPQLLMSKPQLMRVLPVELEIPVDQKAMPFEQVSILLETSQSFGVKDCVCNKNKKLMNEGCNKPGDICMAISSNAGAFDDDPLIRSVTREEARSILKIAEKAALVHLTANVQEDQAYICNCCSCCCPVLGAVKMYNSSVILNTSYVAEIEPEKCDSCGICKEDRCQVDAILSGRLHFQVIEQKCIGCGLCIDTCPSQAIELVKKETNKIFPTPKNEVAWLEERGKNRGVDYGKFIVPSHGD